MHLVKEQSALPRLLAFPLLAMVLASIFVLRHWPKLVLDLASCPLREMTGVPCPTCGGTQAAVEIAHGFWFSAFMANPLVLIMAFLAGIWTIFSLLATMIPPWRRTLILGRQEKRATRILAALLVTGTWAWEIVKSLKGL